MEVQIPVQPSSGNLLSVHLGHEGIEFLQVLFSCLRYCESDGKGLKGDADLVELLKLLGGESRDDRTPMRGNLDQSLGLELPQGFPDGDATDAQLPGQVVLREPGAVGQVPYVDRFSQGVHDRFLSSHPGQLDWGHEPHSGYWMG